MSFLAAKLSVASIIKFEFANMLSIFCVLIFLFVIVIFASLFIFKMCFLSDLVLYSPMSSSKKACLCRLLISTLSLSIRIKFMNPPLTRSWASTLPTPPHPTIASFLCLMSLWKFLAGFLVFLVLCICSFLI